jgi:16S rRNA processing protein RimM
VLVGKVLGAHGLRGEIRARALADDPEALLAAPRVLLGMDPDGAAAIEYEVARAAPGRKGEVRIGLAGIADRTAAEGLRGRYVLLDPRYLPELPPGEFYAYQLAGCRVVGHEGTEVGVVREVWPTAGHGVLVVEAPDGRTHLLPAARELLREVDLPGRRLVFELLPGLLAGGDGD